MYCQSIIRMLLNECYSCISDRFYLLLRLKLGGQDEIDVMTDSKNDENSRPKVLSTSIAQVLRRVWYMLLMAVVNGRQNMSD